MLDLTEPWQQWYSQMNQKVPPMPMSMSNWVETPSLAFLLECLVVLACHLVGCCFLIGPAPILIDVCVQTLLASMSQTVHAPTIAARKNTGRFSYIFVISCPHKSMHSPINSVSLHINSQQCLPPLFQCHITIKGENPCTISFNMK